MEQISTYIVVEITGVLDYRFPIFVACEFVDAHQQKHEFVEKLPVLSDDTQPHFPKIGYIACIVEKEVDTGNGRSLVQVNTETAWGIASQQGKTIFEVSASDLVRR